MSQPENALDLPGDLQRIVVTSQPSSIVRFAAGELQQYLAKLIGQQLPISQEAQPSANEAAFVLSVAGHGEEDGFTIDIDPPNDRLWIHGRNERSVLFGVYHLLWEMMGARWVGLGEEGEILPEQKQFSLEPEHIREDAMIRRRGFYLDSGQFSVNEDNIVMIVDWLAKNRGNYLLVSVSFFSQLKAKLVPAMKQRGMHLEVGHHGTDFYVDPEQYFDAHPEWFSMVGTRRQRGFEALGMHHDTQLCSSNDEVLKLYCDRLLGFLEANPEIDTIGVIPNDGRGWCECPDCLQLERHGVSHPLSGADGLPTLDVASGRYQHFVRRVIERIGDRLNGRRLAFWAYAAALPPTDIVTQFPEHVTVSIALFERRYDRPIHHHNGDDLNARFAQLLEDWRDKFRGEINVYEYYAKYVWLGMPKWMPGIIRDDTRFFADSNLQGLLSMIEPETWRVYEPNYLAHMRMSWSRTQRSEAFVDDYTRHCFGQSNDQVAQRVRQLVEVMKPFAKPGPVYPRPQTPQAIAQVESIGKDFARFASHYEPHNSLAHQRLTTWEKNLWATQLRFELNRLYHELRESVELEDFADARQKLTTWNQQKQRYLDMFDELKGSGALLSDKRWLTNVVEGGLFGIEDQIEQWLDSHQPSSHKQAILDKLHHLSRKYAC